MNPDEQSPQLQTLFAAAQSLPALERLRLAEHLLASLEDDLLAGELESPSVPRGTLSPVHPRPRAAGSRQRAVTVNVLGVIVRINIASANRSR